MTFPAFPAWLSWLLLLAVIWLWIQVGALTAAANSGGQRPRNRQELEAAYTAGQINRDEYERWKDRVK